MEPMLSVKDLVFNYGAINAQPGFRIYIGRNRYYLGSNGAELPCSYNIRFV